MKTSLLLFLLISCTFSCASAGSDEKQNLNDFIISKTEDFFSLPPATFLPKEFSTFNPQLPKVNIITGEYCEEECDLIVAGIEPLSYRRFYGHQGYKDECYGHWRINPESLFLFNFETKRPKFGGIGSENGSFTLFEYCQGNLFTFDAINNRNFTNGEAVTGQNHPFNTQITYKRVRKDRESCHWEGLVVEGNGRKRYFQSDVREWPHSDQLPNPDFIPPYQARILADKKPNGNIIYYSYINCNGDAFGGHRAYHVLNSISAYSAQGVLLGTLQINYQRSKKSGRRVELIHLCGSDGRGAALYHKIREVRAKKGGGLFKSEEFAIYDTVLAQVNASWKPTQYYQYRWENSKTYYNAPFLYQASQDTGRILETSYDLKSKKVIAQSAPVGPNDQMAAIARYEYHADHTAVYDGESNKTIYRFNGDARITRIEKYQNNKLFCAEKTDYNDNTGNVIRKTLEDGRGIAISIHEYAYDKDHNCTEEKKGGEDVITRTFTTDGFNLIQTESDRPGKLVKYSYVPGTNLLTSELLFDNGKICKRIFHTYDDQIGSARIKTIIDDGCSDNPNDLCRVTYRRIIEISPKRTMPCVGLPEQIAEKTINARGEEILLKRVFYAYHPSGKIAQEEHYDANDDLRYCIINTYDERERLSSTTDPLGNTTTFKYDDNFNIVAQCGPRADMRSEWVYDRANRPIEEKELQTDNLFLVTKKKYDKASRLIATIDACGFETRYEYDALGHVTTIFYPDGAVERKVNDALGNVLEEIDANGYTTKREYNFRSQPTAIYHLDGTEEHFVYNCNSGTLNSHTDNQGTKTLYFYDIFDRPIRVEKYSSKGELLKVNSTTYSVFNKLSETDGEGHTTLYKYDFAGRRVAEEKCGKETYYFYDSLGKLCKTQSGDAFYEEEYDVKGQLVGKLTYDLGGNLVTHEQYAYDAAGNRTHVINSRGTTETIYNTRAQPISITDALGNTTKIGYEYKNGFKQIETNPLGIQTVHLHDSRGNEFETFKKNAQGHEIQKTQRLFDGNRNLIQESHVVFEGTIPKKTIIHTWIYGPGNRIEKFVEASKKETAYLYDNTGKLTQLIKPDKTTINSEYDALARLAHFFSQDIDYRYSYDKNDRIVSVSDSLAKTKTTRAYDPHGNVTKEILGNGLSISHAYDKHGRHSQTVFSDGSNVKYSYKANCLQGIARNGFTHQYVERDLEGNVVKTVLPDGLGTISIERDALSRWKNFASPFYKAVFSQDSYDPVGNLCHYQYTDSLGTKKCTYVYDDLEQLISEEGNAYAHDSLYNRLLKNDRHYSVNDFCQLTHDGTNTYEYDANGNLLFDGTFRFNYDTLDRLISVQKGTTKTEYAYDAFNRRLSKTVYVNNYKNKKELYIYDGNNEIGSADESGKIKELRILGEGLGAEIGAAILLELNGKTYVPLHDHRGCIVTLISTNFKTPSETYRYTAFGEQLTPGNLSPWRYSSKRVDPETDFIYFGRRYYSPTLARWITPDPQGFADGPNLYAYLHNCPLTSFDLYGLWSMSQYWGGLFSPFKDIGRSAYHISSRMGQMMYADFQYEHFNDSSLFKAKSQSTLEGWRSVGQFAKTAYNSPLKTLGETLIPGVLAACRNPSDSAAWGRATFDLATLSLSCCKLGQLSRASRVGHLAEETSIATRTASHISHTSRGAESANAAVNLRAKLSGFEKGQNLAVKTRILADGRIRYYGIEQAATNPGVTRSACRVTEYNPLTNRTRSWHECYDHYGKVNRVHPKQLNGQELTSPHYPPTFNELSNP